MSRVDNNVRPDFDEELQLIADYVLQYKVTSEEAFNTARWCLLDTLGCGILALQYPECTKLLGPIIPGSRVDNGCRVPGTQWVLDPVQGAFNIGTMCRWLDYNDTWLAAEWGHPSDNLGGILAVADYLQSGGKHFTVKDILTAMIKAYEIQGILALDNSFNRVGLDHVVLVKVASTAVICQMLGGDRQQILNALSLAWVDGQSLRTYRHAPNTGSRKSWAAGDATSRAVRLALMAMVGEMGYPSVLTAPKWGFYDVSFDSEQFSFQRPFASYVMENILFKIAFPAEFHAQTAVECAIRLHPQVCDRIDEVERIQIDTQESAIRIISKNGPLHNPADRDHCLQYMCAIGLLFGELRADHYQDPIAADPRIDRLREKMEIHEDPRFSKEYHDPNKRSIGNAIQIFYRNGDVSEKVTIEYPLGHRQRRSEGLPLLQRKFVNNMKKLYPEDRIQQILTKAADVDEFMTLSVADIMDLFKVQ